jgi:hypothetical protein
MYFFRLSRLRAALDRDGKFLLSEFKKMIPAAKQEEAEKVWKTILSE